MSWRNSKEYRQWREACRERDGGCVLTGTKRFVHVHHKNHATYFPEQRFDVDNGVTVFGPLHILFHISFMRGYRKKCTAKDWNRFARIFTTIKRVIKLFS